MNPRRATLAYLAALVVGGVALFWLWPRAKSEAGAASRAKPGAQVRPVVGPPAQPLPAPAVAPGSGEAPSRIADQLNAPGGSGRADLEIVSELFVAWQSNFPREGNPVGENAEITAALTGANRLGYAFIPRTHRAINPAGELCDRWGTPLRLHQVSGTLIEIRSAGPDKKFATADDLNWPPESR